MKKHWWLIACAAVLAGWLAFEFTGAGVATIGSSRSEVRQFALLEMARGFTEMLSPFALIGILVGMYRWYNEPEAPARERKSIASGGE